MEPTTRIPTTLVSSENGKITNTIEDKRQLTPVTNPTEEKIEKIKEKKINNNEIIPRDAPKLKKRVNKHKSIQKSIVKFMEKNLEEYKPEGYEGKDFTKNLIDFITNFMKPNHGFKNLKTLETDGKFGFEVEITKKVEGHFGPGAAIPYSTQFKPGKLQVIIHLHKDEVVVSLSQPIIMTKLGEDEIERCIKAMKVPSVINWAISWFGKTPHQKLREMIDLNNEQINVDSFSIDSAGFIRPYAKIKDNESEKMKVVPVKETIPNADEINTIYESMRGLQDAALSVGSITEERYRFNEHMNNFYLKEDGVPLRDLAKHTKYAAMRTDISDTDYYQLYWKNVDSSKS